MRSPSAIQDRLCAPKRLQECAGGLTVAGDDGNQRSCSCPQPERCQSCFFVGEDEAEAWLQRVDEVPLDRQALDTESSCMTVSIDSDDPVVTCGSWCRQSNGCTAFFVSSAMPATQAQCCLQTSFSASRGFVDVNGGRFYSLPQCQQCKPGFSLLQGICTPPLPPPLFAEGNGHLPGGAASQKNNTIAFGLPITPHQPLFIFQATSARNVSEQRPITYSLKEQRSPFTLNSTSGALLAPRYDQQFIGALSITVVATENVDDCATFPDGRRSCETMVTMNMLATGFSSCPSDSTYYVRDNTSTIDVAWPHPVLVPNADGALHSTASHQPGQYGVGAVDVTFSSDPLDIGLAVCRFRVKVQNGLNVPISTIGELRSPLQLLFFLVDSLGVTNARSDTPTLPLVPAQPTIAIGFTIEGMHPFTAEIPSGVTARFVVDMTWCTSTGQGLVDKDAPLSQGVGSAFLVAATGVSIATRARVQSCNFTDLGSGFTLDNACFVFRAISDDLMEGVVSINALNIMFESDTAGASHTATQSAFRLVPGSSTYLQYSMSTDAAIASMDDFQPPVWISCPPDDEPAREMAPAGANGTKVFWNMPLAVDTGGDVLVSWTHAPGDFFSIAGSPHTVTYTAEDNSGLQSQCVIRVIVDYATVANTFVGGMDTTFKQQVDINEQLRMFSVSHSVASKLSNSDNTFSQFITDLTVSLDGLNTITITLAMPQGRALLRPDGDALITVLEMDMTWAVTQDGLDKVAGEDLPPIVVKPSFNFDNFEGNNSPSSGSQCCKANGNQFANAQAEVDEDGNWIHIHGVSHRIESSFLFSGVTLTLAFPSGFQQGSGQSGLRSLRLLDRSTLRFKALFDHAHNRTEDVFVRRDYLVQVDHAPPVLHGCPSAMRLPTIPGTDYAIATWNAPTATDNVKVAKITSSHVSGSKFFLRKLGEPAVPVVIQSSDK